MKTNYNDLVGGLVDYLERMLNEDMGIPKNRHSCSSRMFGAYYSMSSFEEKELCTWIMNAGSDLDIDPLDMGHPQRDEEIEEYKAGVRKVIDHLKTYLPPEKLNDTGDENKL